MSTAARADANITNLTSRRNSLRTRISELAKNCGRGATIKLLPNGHEVLVLGAGICQAIDGDDEWESENRPSCYEGSGRL